MHAQSLATVQNFSQILPSYSSAATHSRISILPYHRVSPPSRISYPHTKCNAAPATHPAQTPSTNTLFPIIHTALYSLRLLHPRTAYTSERIFSNAFQHATLGYRASPHHPHFGLAVVPVVSCRAQPSTIAPSRWRVATVVSFAEQVQQPLATTPVNINICKRMIHSLNQSMMPRLQASGFHFPSRSPLPLPAPETAVTHRACVCSSPPARTFQSVCKTPVTTLRRRPSHPVVQSCLFRTRFSAQSHPIGLVRSPLHPVCTAIREEQPAPRPLIIPGPALYLHLFPSLCNSVQPDLPVSSVQPLLLCNVQPPPHLFRSPRLRTAARPHSVLPQSPSSSQVPSSLFWAFCI